MSIFENPPSPPIPLAAKSQRMEAAVDSAVPVAQGEQVVTVHVSMTWEIR